MSLLKRWLGGDSKPAPSSTSKASPPRGGGKKKQKAAAGNQAKQPKSDKAVKSANGHTDNGQNARSQKDQTVTERSTAFG